MNNLETLTAIAERYENLDIPGFNPESRVTTIIDLGVTEDIFPEGNFEVLLNFPDSDFCHDIFGIKRHINRETMEIEDFFVPRFVDASKQNLKSS